mgnify:CR=1 FL=1
MTMTHPLAAEAEQALQGVTEGRAVQFHPHYCKEAEGAPFSDWDSSHDVSVIRPDGSRYRIASFRHADDAAFDQFARAWVPEAAAALTALSADAAALKAQVAELTAEANSRSAMFATACAERDAADAKVARLEGALRDLDDVTAIAANFTTLVRCKGGRLRNTNRGPYVCMICGADTGEGEPCRAALTEGDTTNG